MAYGVIMTVFAMILLFIIIILIKENKRGLLMSPNKLKPGKYQVLAKSEEGWSAILISIDRPSDECVGVYMNTTGVNLPDVGATFQWKVKKLKGYEREVIPV